MPACAVWTFLTQYMMSHGTIISHQQRVPERTVAREYTLLATTGGLKNPNIQADKDGNDMHMGVECDHCHQCPIIGPRFSSQVVSDFDLCNTCHDLPECEALAPFRVIQKTSGRFSNL